MPQVPGTLDGLRWDSHVHGYVDGSGKVAGPAQSSQSKFCNFCFFGLAPLAL